MIPVILAVWFASECERFFNKFVPDLVKFFFVPMLTLLAALPVTVIFLGRLRHLVLPNISVHTGRQGLQSYAGWRGCGAYLADPGHIWHALGIHSGLSTIS